MFVRSGFPFNYDPDSEGDVDGLDCSGDPGKTQQSFRDECDINTIVMRFGLTGQIPQGVRMPSYEDFTGVMDFKSALNAIIEAEESFATMPANVRARFHNDPGEFVAFCNDRENLAEARKLGLVPPEELVKPPDPLLVRVVPDPVVK